MVGQLHIISNDEITYKKQNDSKRTFYYVPLTDATSETSLLLSIDVQQIAVLLREVVVLLEYLLPRKLRPPAPPVSAGGCRPASPF